MTHMRTQNYLLNQSGYVGHPAATTLFTPWYNQAKSIPANVRSAYGVPNPVVIAQHLPTIVSAPASVYGNLPPVMQEPLGTNTRI